MERLDLVEATPDLVIEDDPELAVGRLEVGHLDVGGLGDRASEFFEVVLVDHVVLGELLDPAAHLVCALLEALVLGDDLEGGNLRSKPFDLCFGESDLAPQIGRGTDDPTPYGIVDGLPQLVPGRLAGIELAVPVDHLPVQPKEVGQIRRCLGGRLSGKRPGRLVEAVSGDPADEERQERATTHSGMVTLQPEEVPLDDAIPLLHRQLDVRAVREERVGRHAGYVPAQRHDLGIVSAPSYLKRIVLPRPVHSEAEGDVAQRLVRGQL
ncbi:hypothetical protein [Streptomyces sp. NPDC052107]|uniref:hypothetical protein n=1 Tax=Streptomyces TaxID=1883 RepID=UPI00343B9D2E